MEIQNPPPETARIRTQLRNAKFIRVDYGPNLLPIV